MTGSPSSHAAPMYRPRGLLLQWHVTERCNLRCAHCYQERYAGDELTLEQLLSILAQYEALLDGWSGDTRESRVPGHVTVTGGEPFVRRDFFELLEALAARRERLSFAILSNGTLIDDDVAKRLRALRPAFVQISIDGTRETHDAIRGRGNFDRAVAALRRLRRQRVRTMISFSASRHNFRELPEVVRIGEALGVDRVWTDRVIPAGSADAAQALAPHETRELCETLATERRRVARRLFVRTEVSARRALQFLASGEEPYHCTAGDTLITLLPNGDVHPCRRMPICVGNVLATPLAEIYQQNHLLQMLRDPRRESRGCERCEHAPRCRGGLRCLSHALCGDPLTADPGCWLAAPSDPPRRC
ncbi:MAG: radical SAM protein [Myxococcales bacterium]|nr:radical SAM protein [Myxococcales bacterium]